MKGFWVFRAVVIVSTLVFAPVCIPAHGQFSAGHTMSVNVPFSFDLGDKHFTPGAYTVSTPMSDVVELSNGSNAGLVLGSDQQGSRPAETSKIVFNRYGNRYFLRQIWFRANESFYLECPESKSEKQTKRSEFASNSKKPSNVQLTMLRLR